MKKLLIAMSTGFFLISIQAGAVVRPRNIHGDMAAAPPVIKKPLLEDGHKLASKPISIPKKMATRGKFVKVDPKNKKKVASVHGSTPGKPKVTTLDFDQPVLAAKPKKGYKAIDCLNGYIVKNQAFCAVVEQKLAAKDIVKPSTKKAAKKIAKNTVKKAKPVLAAKKSKASRMIASSKNVETKKRK